MRPYSFEYVVAGVVLVAIASALVGCTDYSTPGSSPEPSPNGTTTLSTTTLSTTSTRNQDEGTLANVPLIHLTQIGWGSFVDIQIGTPPQWSQCYWTLARERWEHLQVRPKECCHCVKAMTQSSFRANALLGLTLQDNLPPAAPSPQKHHLATPQ